MNAAIEELNAVIVRFKTFERNFKKCSQANRTKGYLEGRLKGIDELWALVCEADEKINSLKTKENENIAYFEDDNFSSIEEKYFQVLGDINEYLNAFNPQPSVSSNRNNNNQQ